MHEKYDPNIHHRRSIRIAGYDYSQDGWYFITICTQNRKYMFGEIMKDQMRLNDAGLMVKTLWQKLANKFPTVQTDEHIIMPNHFHGIINIAVGAILCGRPDPDVADCILAQSQNNLGQPHRIAPTLGDIVNWLKTMTTNQYIQGVKQNAWPAFPGRLWQRNYYEHIIRNETELNRFRHYIADNPANWQTDEENQNVNAARYITGL